MIIPGIESAQLLTTPVVALDEPPPAVTNATDSFPLARK